MYHSSEDAIEAAERISLEAARRELKAHYCRVVDFKVDDLGASTILVTNDMDEPEWIGCDTRSILLWLGY